MVAIMGDSQADRFLPVCRTFDPADLEPYRFLWSSVLPDHDELPASFADRDMVSKYHVLVDDKALFIIEHESGNSLRMHPLVLPDYRKENYDIFMSLSAWVLANLPVRYAKINLVVPIIYPHLKRFAIHVGFIEEGINRQSSLRNGRLVDQWYLGITYPELIDKLQRY